MVFILSLVCFRFLLFFLFSGWVRFIWDYLVSVASHLDLIVGNVFFFKGVIKALLTASSPSVQYFINGICILSKLQTAIRISLSSPEDPKTNSMPTRHHLEAIVTRKSISRRSGYDHVFLQRECRQGYRAWKFGVICVYAFGVVGCWYSALTLSDKKTRLAC